MKSLPRDTTVKSVRKGIISSGLTARYVTFPRYGLPIRRLAPRSFLLPVRNKNDRCATSGERTVGWVVRIVEKFVKKNPSLILRCVRRGGRIISGLTWNPRQRILHTRPFRCRETRLAVCPAVSWAVCLR